MQPEMGVEPRAHSAKEGEGSLKEVRGKQGLRGFQEVTEDCGKSSEGMRLEMGASLQEAMRAMWGVG